MTGLQEVAVAEDAGARTNSQWQASVCEVVTDGTEEKGIGVGLQA